MTPSDPDQPADAAAGPTDGPEDTDLALRRQAIASGDPSRAMPALAGLREVAPERAIPLLLLGLEQEPFLIRSLACSGLGVKRSEEGWQALVQALRGDADANVRAEAANALASYGVERSWPLLRQAFAADAQWLVRCSILSALAEQPEIPLEWLLELAGLAIADGDGTVRVGGAELLGRILHEASQPDDPLTLEAREAMAGLQSDPDHRVVAVAFNALRLG
ncbi:MAG: HEAT repeat domain-containing protein [Cyanobium sp.]